MNKLKQTLTFLCLTILAFGAMQGCDKDTNHVEKFKTVLVKIGFGESGINPSDCSEVTLEINEINTGKKTSAKNSPGKVTELKLKQGMYTIMAKGRLKSDTLMTFSGIIENLEISDKEIPEQVIPVRLDIGSADNLVIKEIGIAGNRDLSSSPYIWDSYFIIHNNSDKIIYADSLCIMESYYNASDIGIALKDKEKESNNFIAGSLFMIPGNGRQYPVAPGGDIIIADQAKNHILTCPNSYDLSKADFEWYDTDSFGIAVDEDNPSVPNLIKIASLSFTLWRPNAQGITAFAIGKLKEGVQTFLEKNPSEYERTYTDVDGDVTTGTDEAIFFPVEWIIDAVQMCPKSITERKRIINEKLDKGYTYCHLTDNPDDAFGFGKVNKRKVEKTVNGIVIYKDTNNSEEDFDTVQETSLK